MLLLSFIRMMNCSFQPYAFSYPAEKFVLNLTPSKTCSFESAPVFTVPLKAHATPEKYECYMSCAVRGDPTPRVTWYRNNISLNANPNYYITNTCGVCSMLILRVGPKDNGEYKVVAENASGRAECATQLTILGLYLNGFVREFRHMRVFTETHWKSLLLLFSRVIFLCSCDSSFISNINNLKQAVRVYTALLGCI